MWTLLLAVILAMIGACGGNNATSTDGPEETDTTAATDGTTATTSGRSEGSNPRPCLEDADISGLVGFAVRLLQETVKTTPTAALCTYQPTDASVGTGVEITIAIGPESVADQVIGDFSTAAKARSGKDPEAIPVGDRGLAFGSGLSSGAVAVESGRVVAISISSPFTNIGDKKTAAIEILTKVIG